MFKIPLQSHPVELVHCIAFYVSQQIDMSLTLTCVCTPFWLAFITCFSTKQICQLCKPQSALKMPAQL